LATIEANVAGLSTEAVVEAAEGEEVFTGAVEAWDGSGAAGVAGGAGAAGGAAAAAWWRAAR